MKENDAGAKAADLCRRHGISPATLYKWKSKFGGMEVSDAKRLRELESENSKLKRLVAALTLDNAALKEVAIKKVVRPLAKRKVAGLLVETHHLSRSHSCNLLGLSRSTAYYHPVKPDDEKLRDRLKKLARSHRRYGYLRIHYLVVPEKPCFSEDVVKK